MRSTRISPTRISPTRISPTRISPTRISPTRISPTRISPTRTDPTTGAAQTGDFEVGPRPVPPSVAGAARWDGGTSETGSKREKAAPHAGAAFSTPEGRVPGRRGGRCVPAPLR
ncbi:hypothetical protein GCM10027176_16550 [Actinoallomurus bryophytorum]